ncbi:hypothetical protein T07_2378 [Trichinella nelsoni]|uniref:Integrase zinc-binding domain-containing protein n=1 Tax=Trichinella nelsoni TaxID=6336 RepID=A0A0V0SG92_9BILA|nr:hypothetical protein T07_2378 [Trichinella nelsoni]
MESRSFKNDDLLQNLANSRIHHMNRNPTSESCLSGEALQLLSGLTITAENYEALVQLLYDHTASNQSQTKGVAEDEISKHLLEICALVLLPVLIKLLPIGTRTRWKARNAKLNEEQLTSQTFLTFLSLQALCMDNTEDSAAKKRRSSPVRQNVRRQPHRHSTIDALPASLSLKCAVCHGEHHMLRPEHRATECRVKNRGWGLHHFLVLMSSNQQAQRQAEPDDHVPPLKQVSHRSKKGNNLPCIARQHTRFSQNPVSNSEAVLNKSWSWKIRRGPRLGWSGRDCNREGNRRYSLHPNIGQKSWFQTKPSEVGPCPVRRLEAPPTFADSKGARREAPCPRVNRRRFLINTGFTAQKEDNMECTLKKFWELESIGHQHQEEKMTQDLIRLPDNRPLAEHRLQTIERSIRKDLVKRLEYIAVTGEYLRNGWAEEKMVNGELKCRVVFDGSVKYGGVSLNECLETDPNLQADLADIEKMYLQVGLRVEDRDACRFLWRNCSQDEPVRAYRLTRVCFGLACSPYFAINVIKAHAKQNPEECDEVIKRALCNMFVHDLVISCDEESEVAELIRRVPVFLKRGRFHLKKWASNRAELLATLPRTEVSKIGDRELSKALGVYWLKDEDVITFKPPTDSTTQSRATKRQLLSLVAKAKMMFQWLWTTELSWDSPLPPKISKQWRRWQEELKKLLEVKLSRPWIREPWTQQARCESGAMDGAPRLRRCIQGSIRCLRLPESRVHGCANLGEINDSENPGDTNKTNQPPETGADGSHAVRKIEAQSDSRLDQGLLPALLLSQAFTSWKPFVAYRMKWPKEPAELDKNDKTLMSEQKTIKVLTTQVNEEGIERVIDPFRYNSYERLIRVTTYCLRFTRNVQLPLTEREKRDVLEHPDIAPTLLQIESKLEVMEAEKRIRRSRQSNEDGLLRTDGRLRQSTLPPESKHPILLPSHHPVVELLIRNQHIRQLHASVNQTLVAIRIRFWIIKARNTVKKVIQSCPICRRINAQPYQLVERVEESAPFSHTGVDFAGPLYTRSDTRARNPSTNKTYISFFTCMVTRAVHLEIVREQTASCFLNALRRFISRRGRPRVIQSDNFRSFKLADEFLRRLFHSAEWNEVQSKLNEERTE